MADQLTPEERAARQLRDQLIGKPPANNLEVKGDFNDRNTGKSVSAYEGMEFKNGDFKMPKPLLDAAKVMAQELITIAQQQGVDLSKSPQWKDAGLLTNDGKINVDSLSAYLLAKSMGNNTFGVQAGPFAKPEDHSLTATFDNKLSAEDYKADPKLVFEMARQIMGDNGMRNVVGQPTNTKEADLKFVSDNLNRTSDGISAKC